MVKKIIIILGILFILIIAGSFFYFHNQLYYSTGDFQGTKEVEIKSGENFWEVAQKLEKKEVIYCKYLFSYYLIKEKLHNHIIADSYEFSSSLTMPEVAELITELGVSEKKEELKITFPEGWYSDKMADRVEANGLSKELFLKLVKNPEAEFERNFEFIDKNTKSLEGYLFPDTYFVFPEDLEVEKVLVRKMLENFDQKLTYELRSEIEKQGKTISEIVNMASIIEHEVPKEEDRKIVSGIFWKRVNDEYPLQSCATLSYALGVNKKQFSIEDTQTKSPFNTYQNVGLPPAPIGNPGLSAITASIYPEETDYYFFLNNPETGETVFSKTLEQHNVNKARNGL